jgi:hypothetical protein
MTLQVEASMLQHVEGHFLYSLNYMHFGKPKVWYGVPSGETVKLEESTRKNLLKLFEEHPDLLHELVIFFSVMWLAADLDIYVVVTYCQVKLYFGLA